MEVFFLSWGQKNFFPGELLRPFVRVKNDFLKFLIFERAKPHLVSDAHAEHTRQELMRMLSIRISFPFL